MEKLRNSLYKRIKKLANLEYSNILRTFPSSLKADEKEYVENKRNEIDDNFDISTTGDIFSVTIKNRKLRFIKDFIQINYDTPMEFNISYDPSGKATIFVRKNSMSDIAFENIINAMYAHTLA